MSMTLDPAVELRFTKLLSAINEYKASALHLSVGVPPSLRIADQIFTLTGEDLLTEEFIAQLVTAILTPEQQQVLQLQRSLVLCTNLKSKTRCKLHIYYQQQNLSVTISLIPAVVRAIEQLLVPQAVKDLTRIERGLIIVAGSYGQGKTTVMAGLVESLNQTSLQHIVTFEQPTEYIFTDTKAIVEQVELGQDLPDVAAIIPFVHQEDVDTILLATTFDATVMKTALQLAQMGKLVILEVTAPTCDAALNQCLNVFLSSEQATIRQLLADTLQAVVALRMTKTANSTTVLMAEVLRQNPGLSHLLKTDTFEKLPFIIENGHNDGMITFAQSFNELQLQ